MHKDEAAMALADAFIIQYRKYDFRFPNIHKVRNSKWWMHFERAAELRYIEDWKADIWVKCQFDKYGKILPFQLYGKMAQEAFQEYKHRYISGKSDRRVQIVSGMLSTYNSIKTWCKKNNIDEIDYEAYFKSNLDKVLRNQLSPYFLSICKPFMENYYYPGQGEIDEMKLKRAWIYKNPKLKNKLKETLGVDFY